MAIQEFVGAVVLEVDGEEIECTSFSAKEATGRMPVKTMNRKRRAKGRCALIPEFTLKVTLPIPVEGEPDWLAFDDGKVTMQSIEGGDRWTYQGCFVMDMSGSFKVDGEASRTLTIGAVNRVKE